MKTTLKKISLVLLLFAAFAAPLRAESFADAAIPLTALLIPLAAILMPLASIVIVAALFLYFRYRRNRLVHETLRVMVEKGVPIPPELITPPVPMIKRRAKSDLRSGLVMLAFGFGVMILLVAMHIHGAWPIGLIFMLMGGAFLLTSKLEKKDATDSEVAPK